MTQTPKRTRSKTAAAANTSTAAASDLVVALTDIVRWATANLSPEFIRDTPAASYRAVAATIADHHPDKALAGELAAIFIERAEAAEAWETRRGLRDAAAADAANAAPYPLAVAAGYSRKAVGNAGIFEGADNARPPGVLRRAWRWLFG